MCRIEERVYVSPEGKRSMFEERFPCDKSRNGKLCSKVKKKTSEYHIKSGSSAGHSKPYPVSPPTPTGTGPFLVQERRPSSSGGRPSTRDGQKNMAPEIVINFNAKKENGKRHTGITVSTKTHKSSSLMTGPTGSNDFPDDSLGSDASHTIRTGFPDAPLPAPTGFGHSGSYMPSVAHGYRHRQTSSMSSANAPSQPPSLCVTSDPDYESPDSRRSNRHPPKIFHDQNTAMRPPSPPHAPAPKPSAPFRTSAVTPRDLAHKPHAPEGIHLVDHGDLADRSASSYASSGLPENTRKSKVRDERRKRKEDDNPRREDPDAVSRQVAEELAKQNAKQVRFELDRPLARERERAQKFHAEKENDRIQARESARQHERKEREKREREEREKREREEEETSRRKKDKSKASPATQEGKPASQTQKPPLTKDQLAEQRRLLAAEEDRMKNERMMAEARDREEQYALLRHKQDSREYFDPRGGDRSLGRRLSVSRQSGAPLPSILSPLPTNHRRPSLSSTQLGSNLPNHPASVRPRLGPPISFPANFSQAYDRATSTRRPSFGQPDVSPSVRKRRDSGSSVGNPFANDAAVVLSSPSVARPDRWDMRNVQSSLSVASPGDNRPNTLQQRGHAVLNRSVQQQQQQQQQQQTQRVPRPTYQDLGVFEDDDDHDVDDVEAYASRSGRRW